MSEITLSQLLQQSITDAQDLLEGVADQSKLQTLLSNFKLCAALIDRLALFSPNEALEDLTTSSLRCFLVEYYQGLLTGQLKSIGTVQRQAQLTEAKLFIKRLEQYDLVDGEQQKQQQASTSANLALKRLAKIASFKLEKELSSRIKDLEVKRASRVTVNAPAEDEDDEFLRPMLLTQLNLSYLKASNELTSISSERELLSHAVPYSDLPSSSHKDEDTSWRLEARSKSWFDPSAGPILSNEGKVLRPFTILPTNMSTRLKLQDQVFRPSHNLPTMSIDEFLDLEMERGNVLQGGEADAQKQDEESRRRKELLEEDNLTGYDADEAKLAELRAGDEFRDSHRRGEGNRIGRG